MNIALVTPCRRFIANRFGLGYQVPLGLVSIGGPLLDAGHRVRLIDNDVLGWSDRRLARELEAFSPDCVLVGHTASTAAHPAAIRAMHELRRRLPAATIVYGGVYPTNTAVSILRENPAVDVIVRGEGELTVLALTTELERGKRQGLRKVRGITWRAGARIFHNPPQQPIRDLDRYRPGWELVDWDRYHLFGMGRAAGIQFSRGCPLSCTYCGQWSFWRKWRHRSPEVLVDQLRFLAEEYRVRAVWFADENFAADRDLARSVLERIAEQLSARGLRLSLNLNMTAADVVRDEDLMELYKRAGVDNVVLGIESLDDATVKRVGKNNSLDVSRRALEILRRHRIVSLVNLIYGLENECLTTVWRTYRRLLALDPDVLNAVYVTPHSWTPLGRQTKPGQVIQDDLARYTYRDPVLETPGLPPRLLLALVKLTELLFHLRPRALWRLLGGSDSFYRRILRAYFKAGARVWCAELLDSLRTRFVPPGSQGAVPGFPKRGALANRPEERSPRGETSPVTAQVRDEMIVGTPVGAPRLVE